MQKNLVKKQQKKKSSASTQSILLLIPVASCWADIYFREASFLLGKTETVGEMKTWIRVKTGGFCQAKVNQKAVVTSNPKFEGIYRGGEKNRAVDCCQEFKDNITNKSSCANSSLEENPF